MVGLLAILLALALFPSEVYGVGAAQGSPPRCDWSGQVYNDFYEPLPDLGQLTPDRLGEILRVEHIGTYTPQQVASAARVDTSEYGALAYRILYLSQEPVGVPREVSGLIIVPVGPMPESGYPVIIDGHPTVGMADICAPSKNPLRPWNLLPYVAQGYIVTSTDYVGLGTRGSHPYAVGSSAARNMLDAGRAALRFCDAGRNVATSADNRMVLEGHSQGGHAALFAHEAWKNYAPELNILGTVAFAPGSEPLLLAELMANNVNSMLVEPVAMAMYSYSQYYGAPTNPGDWLLEPYASELSQRVEDQCFVAVGLWLGFKPESVFRADLLDAVADRRWDAVQPWKDYMDRNTPGNFRSEAPVLIIQGGADPLVPLAVSVKLQQRLCASGTVTRLSLYPAEGHSGPRFAMPEALQWIAGRLAGEAPVGSCFVPRFTYLPMVIR